MGRRTLAVAQIALLATSLAVVVLTSRASDWAPLSLVFLLTALAILSDGIAISTRSLRLSGAFISLVLAMALLGAGPAVMIGLVTTAIDAVRNRLRIPALLANLSAYATFPLVGALLVR